MQNSKSPVSSWKSALLIIIVILVVFVFILLVFLGLKGYQELPKLIRLDKNNQSVSGLYSEEQSTALLQFGALELFQHPVL